VSEVADLLLELETSLETQVWLKSEEMYPAPFQGTTIKPGHLPGDPIKTTDASEILDVASLGDFHDLVDTERLDE